MIKNNEYRVFNLKLFDIMSVQNGRHARRLLPAEIAFREVSRQKILKPSQSFGHKTALSLFVVITGTILTTLGILQKQIWLIIMGFVIMLSAVTWFVVSSAYA